MSSVLLVRLKIPDLTALTALDAGRALLPAGHELSRLVREEVVLFEPAAGIEEGERERLQAALRHAVETSNFFVNPNKERYRLLTSADRGATWTPPEGAWGILTRPRGDTRDAGLLERLQREHPLAGLAAIRRARVWWLWTKAPAQDGSPGIEAALNALGPVERAGRGLLVNPHSEAWLLLSAPAAWTRIETFLAEPASEPEAART